MDLDLDSSNSLTGQKTNPASTTTTSTRGLRKEEEGELPIVTNNNQQSNEQNEEDDDNDDGDDDEEEEVVEQRKILPRRATRGLRMSNLVGEAAEADEAFWGQAAFDEDDSDEEYSSSSEAEGSDGSSTSTDSDIDLPEPEDDEEGGMGGGGGVRGTTTKAAFMAARRRTLAEEEEDTGFGGGGGGKKRGGGGGGAAGGGRSGRYVDPALRGSGGLTGKSADYAAMAAAAAAAEAAAAAISVGGGGGVSSSSSSSSSSTFVFPHTPSSSSSSSTTLAGRSFRKSTTEKVAFSEATRLHTTTATTGSGSSPSVLGVTAMASLDHQQEGADHGMYGPGGFLEGGGAGHGTPLTTASPSAAALLPSLSQQPQPTEPKLSQAEILTDAAHTTVESLRQLDSLVRMETERQARDAELAARSSKTRVFPPGVPLLRFHSKRGFPTTFTFTEVDHIPSIINSSALVVGSGGGNSNSASSALEQKTSTSSGPTTTKAAADKYPRSSVCVVTGRPAKYMDPLTRQPYADIAAFKILRAKYAEQEAQGIGGRGVLPSQAGDDDDDVIELQDEEGEEGDGGEQRFASENEDMFDI